MEKAVLNVKELKVTQGMNGSYSHKGDLAIDIGSACSYLKAPFTGKVKRIYQYEKRNHQNWCIGNLSAKLPDTRVGKVQSEIS